jgi:hypothetical protein
MWIAMGMFARAIGTTSAAGCVETASNGTTELRGHGGRLIDTVGAKLLTDILRTAECRPKPARKKICGIGLVSRLVAV